MALHTGVVNDALLLIGYDADQRESTHPVAPDPPDVPDTDAARSSYDDISYAKGASALRQLVAWLGWPAFLDGINDYFARYRFGSATLADLLDCLTRASGADVGEWAGHWLRSSGVDTLTVARPEPPGRIGCISHAGGRPHRVWVGVALSALVFGGEDFCLDMGIPRTADGSELAYARSHVARRFRSP